MLACLAFRGEKGAKRGLDTKTQTKRDAKGVSQPNAKTLHGGLFFFSPRTTTGAPRAIIGQFSELMSSSNTL